MRLVILFFILLTASNASNSVSYFKNSSNNQLLCHVGQHSFKIVSQKNAEIKEMNGHLFFKLTNENMYFLNNTCQPIKDKKEGVIF